MTLDEPKLTQLNSELTVEQLQTQLTIQKDALALLLEQRAKFGSLHVPTYVMQEIHDRHEAMTGLKLLLSQKQSPKTGNAVTAAEILLLRPWLLIMSGGGIGALLVGTSVWRVLEAVALNERVGRTLGSTIGALITGSLLGWGIIQLLEWLTIWRTSSWRWRWILILVTGALIGIFNWVWAVITHWLWG